MVVRKNLAEVKAKPFKFSDDERRRLKATTETEIARQAAQDQNAATDEELKLMAVAREVRQIREGAGLNQADFASRYQLTLGRLRDWEQGRHAPDPAILTYLRLIRDEPRAVHRALKKAG